VALLLSLVAVAAVFHFHFDRTGKEVMSMFRAGIPIAAGLGAALLLGKLNKLSHHRWQIYLVVMIAVAILVSMRLF